MSKEYGLIVVGIVTLLMVAAMPVYSQNLSAVSPGKNKVVEELERIEETHIYLKHLDTIQESVRKELAIVKLMRECDQLNAVCSGQGLSLKPPLPPPVEPPTETEPLIVEKPDYVIPVLLSTYRQMALLEYKGRKMEITAGENIGPFNVNAVNLNYVELNGPDGDLRVFLQWQESADD